MIKDKDFILLCAFRYALYRQTYAPTIVADEIINCWDSLTIKDQLYKEINEAWDNLDYINRKVWKSVLDKIEETT